jgi:hypothetical protein
MAIMFGPKDKVPMGRHQAIGQEGTGGTLKSFIQNVEVGVKIGRFTEQVETCRATVESVVDEAAKGMAWCPY